MKRFKLSQFTYEIICDEQPSDARVSFEQSGDALSVFLTAEKDRPQFVKLKWAFETDEPLYVFGDAWERGYGDLRFERLSGDGRPLPWYFAATDKEKTTCFGVKTQPNAFICFTYDESGVTACIDCRNGGGGVRLDGRTIKLCTFVLKRYDLPPYESLCDYCKTLCEKPLLPKEKIYGGNNWYYAYGKSSRGEILSDAKLQAALAKGIENKPFMVIDDGWSVHDTEGPWYPNKKFGDMRTLADGIRALGARPGIWVRLLHNRDPKITKDMRIRRGGKRRYLDPTHPKVQTLIRNDIERFRGWGYELVKHDFSTVDLFGDFGGNLTDTITNVKGWHFYDETKTNAEITLDFYRLILDACGDMLIIGCNTVSHLCAGLVQINRTGDDTSGREWARTRKMGLNTLAFRLAQNNAFYLADADCVGILGDKIPWEKNRQWLDLLSKSDTALFLSCARVTDEQRADIEKAFVEIQKDHDIKPLDIYENLTPRRWRIDGGETVYNWD